jgi:histidinol-phosphate aminotransferase
MVMDILEQREWLSEELKKMTNLVIKVFPSSANFILVKTKDGRKVYDYLITKKIITRDRSTVLFCEGSLRISIGKKEENQALVNALKEYK